MDKMRNEREMVYQKMNNARFGNKNRRLASFVLDCSIVNTFAATFAPGGFINPG